MLKRKACAIQKLRLNSCLATLVNVTCRNVNKDLDIPFDCLLGADGRESVNSVLVDLIQE